MPLNTTCMLATCNMRVGHSGLGLGLDVKMAALLLTSSNSVNGSPIWTLVDASRAEYRSYVLP